MSQEIDASVDAFLREIFIDVKVQALGYHKEADWEFDKWMVTFIKYKTSVTFEYKTGIGLRAEATAQDKLKASWATPGVTANDIKRGTIFGKRYLRELQLVRKAVPPSAASVLNSLLLDSGASTMSFNTWCAEFGYDTDSRKAEQTYRACQEEHDKLCKIFNGAEQDQIRDLTEDY